MMVQNEQKKGIAGSTLKWIAIFAMLIDHIAVTLVYRSMNHEMLAKGMITIEQQNAYYSNHFVMYGTYTAMRCIGRIAFPIFCFLLIEGFIHTKSRKKYVLRLGLFALISEIPFDLSMRCSYGCQNVFFTLFLGLISVICLDEIRKRYIENRNKCILLCFFVSCIFMVVAFVLKTDYSSIGVLSIIIMYLFLHDKMKRISWGTLVLLVYGMIESFAFVNLFFIHKYNGKKGSSMKYAFYWFYPVHLLILSFICICLGI